MSEQSIKEIFENSKAAFNSMSDMDVKRRVKLLKQLEQVLLAEMDNIVNVICEETGKVRVEALTSDFFVSLDTLSYYIKNISKILLEKPVKTSFMFFKTSAFISYRGSGVALIIAPWNFPFQLAFVPVITALASGCSIILKPSNLTPKTGKLIEDIIKQAGFPEYSVQCVFGGADVVNECIEHNPARVFFTGSTSAGRSIGKKCAGLLIPALLELGGKAPAIVLEDADIERTANGIVYSAFANNGQICVAATRLILAQNIYEEFLSVLIKKTKEIKLNRDYGPLIQKERKSYLYELINDSLKNGAEILYQGDKKNNFDAPIILNKITKEMRVFNEECFAPILTVTTFKTESEALDLANSSVSGLSASVWSSDIKKAKDFSNKINAGHISINDAIKGVGVAALPFGGVKDSGIGRYHSSEGIYFFTDTISYFVNKSKSKSEINWLPYDTDFYDSFKTLIKMIYRKTFWCVDIIKSLKYFFKRGRR